MMGTTEPCSVDDLWAGDRSRVGVCVSVTPKDGVPYDHLQREVFGRVDWPERELRWHQHRRAPGDATTGDDDGDANGWVMEATLSCLASSGDESQVAYRIEGLADDVVEEAEVVVSAPCHVPFMELTLRDLDVSAAAVTHRHLGDDDADDAGRRSAELEPRHSPVDTFLRTGLAASCRSAVAPDDLARLIAVANARMSNAEAALATNHPTLDVGADVFAFREMGSRGGRRFDLLFPKPEWERDETEDARERRGVHPRIRRISAVGPNAHRSVAREERAEEEDRWIPFLGPSDGFLERLGGRVVVRRLHRVLEAGRAGPGLALRRATPRGGIESRLYRCRRQCSVCGVRVRSPLRLEPRSWVHAVLGRVACYGRAHRVRRRGGGAEGTRRRGG